MTSVLVVHASKRGSTAEIAEWIAEELRDCGLTVNVRPAGAVRDLHGYDAVILGGALYAGRWPRQGRRFARRHRAALTHLPVWLFSSGPLDHTATEREIPASGQVARIMQRTGARDHATFGGNLAPDAEGWLASRIAEGSGGDYRDRDHVRDWARSVAKEIRSVRI